MELDDLKKRWQALDAKLDGALRLNRRILDEHILSRADKAMTRHLFSLAAELALGIVAVLLTGSFVADHVGEVHFLVPGLALHVFVIAQIGTLVRQIVATRQVDYGAPLVEVQKRVERLRAASIRTTMWTLLLAPLLWTPLFVVALKALLGVDAYATFGVRYLAVNVAVGLVVLALGQLASRRYATRFLDSPRATRLMRALAGTNLTAAAGFLDSLARFEQDDQLS